MDNKKYIEQKSMYTMLDLHKEWLDSEGVKGRKLILTDCNICFLNFKSMDIRYAEFTRCDIRCADFSRGNLEGVMFIDCDLRGAFLNPCDLSLVFFHKTNTDGASCTNSKSTSHIVFTKKKGELEYG